MLPPETVAKPLKPLLAVPGLTLIIAQPPRMLLAPTVLLVLIAPVVGSVKFTVLARPLRVIAPRSSVAAPPVAPELATTRLAPQPIVAPLKVCVFSVLALPVMVSRPSPMAVVGDCE